MKIWWSALFHRAMSYIPMYVRCFKSRIRSSTYTENNKEDRTSPCLTPHNITIMRTNKIIPHNRRSQPAIPIRAVNIMDVCDCFLFMVPRECGTCHKHVFCLLWRRTRVRWRPTGARLSVSLSSRRRRWSKLCRRRRGQFRDDERASLSVSEATFKTSLSTRRRQNSRTPAQSH